MFKTTTTSPARGPSQPAVLELASLQKGVDQEAQCRRNDHFEHYRDDDTASDVEEMRGSITQAAGSSKRTIATLSLQHIFGRTVTRRSEGTAKPSKHDGSHQSSSSSSSQALASHSGIGQAGEVSTILPREPESVQLDADTERALVRCFALAAAVTTWCLLQPFILFHIIAHFKSLHLHNVTSTIALLLFALSLLVGIFVGPRATCEFLRILETGQAPSRRRCTIFGVAMLGTVVLTLMLMLLHLSGD